MKCLKSLACAMLVSMAVVCASDDEAGQAVRKTVFNSKDRDQLTACTDALEMAYPNLATSIAALKVQNLPEAIRLLTLAAADDQMGLLSSILVSVQGVHENCEEGQSDDEEEELDEEEIYAELARRQRLLEAGYVVTDSGEVVGIAELDRRQEELNADL